MTLEAILGAAPGALLVRGAPALALSAITHDSRATGPGALYVALPGRQVHGARFAAQAVAQGAVAVASDASQIEALRAQLPEAVALVTLERPRADLALLSAQLYGQPSQHLPLVGVTGSNGKSTVTTIFAQIVRAAGLREGLIGTHHVRMGDQVRETAFTTPEAPQLQRLLAEMRAAEVSVAAMEVSSIGVAERRVDAVRFAALGFTNLSQDHLDYHHTMTAYAAAKAELFERVRAPGTPAIFDVEDPFGATLRRRFADSYGLAVGSPADPGLIPEITVRDLQMDAAGWRGTLVSPWATLPVRCPLVGYFNVRNAALAAALALSVGLPAEAVQRGLAGAHVRGRLERVGAAPLAVVDYAHTAEALVRVIEAVRVATVGRVWCVFGCGGDRDATKRAPMGAAAATADAVIVTNDNPRSEDPAQIAEVAAQGAVAAGRPRSATLQVGHTWIELDRARAIEATIEVAAPEDLVLIAGKGHEQWQEIAGQRLPFDDVAVARGIFARRGEGRP